MSVPPHPPQAVIKAALMHPVPCPNCGAILGVCGCDVPDSAGYRLDWQAQLITEALADHGHLSTAEQVEPETVEDVAKWLAAESLHPRYYDATGADTERWRKLLESDSDVHVAHTAALKAHPQPDREYSQRLSEARHELLRYATGAARRRTEGVG